MVKADYNLSSTDLTDSRIKVINSTLINILKTLGYRVKHETADVDKIWNKSSIKLNLTSKNKLEKHFIQVQIGAVVNVEHGSKESCISISDYRA